MFASDRMIDLHHNSVQYIDNNELEAAIGTLLTGFLAGNRPAYEGRQLTKLQSELAFRNERNDG